MQQAAEHSLVVTQLCVWEFAGGANMVLRKGNGFSLQGALNGDWDLPFGPSTLVKFTTTSSLRVDFSPATGPTGSVMIVLMRSRGSIVPASGQATADRCHHPIKWRF